MMKDNALFGSPWVHPSKQPDTNKHFRNYFATMMARSLARKKLPTQMSFSQVLHSPKHNGQGGCCTHYR